MVLTTVGITNCQITYIAHFWIGNGYGNPLFSGEIQGEETLGQKVVGSPLEDYIQVSAYTAPEELPHDARVVHRISLHGRKFQAEERTSKNL
ncbi:MAG: hypothetical protein WCN99_05180 [bacterium]